MRPPHEDLTRAAAVMARALLIIGQGHVYDPKCGCARCQPITEGIQVAKQLGTEG